MERASMAGRTFPETAWAIAERITVLENTIVERERQVAIVKGLRRKNAAADHGGREDDARGDL